MEPTRFEQLRPNLASFAVLEGVLRATFRCPVSGRVIEAAAALGPHESPQGVGGLWAAARRGATRMLGGLLGQGATETEPDAARRAAIVAAFESVRAAFVWDAARGHFVAAERAAELQNPFDLMLEAAPLSRRADRDVAARAVWDVIRADGTIHPAEQRFVESLLGADIATARATPELSKLDVDQVSAGCRGTVWMLAVATALSDEHRHAREGDRLARMAQWLDLRDERRAELRNAAAQKVIENILLECYSDGVLDDAERARMALLAQRLGVNEALVAKVDVRLRQRAAARG
ncbi:MAG: hypothetical protein HS108_10610 [Planctomycetes bacterium]|nr:hypothetical protein [Planctomycetota bacterium]MCL4731696.1 hypothetical protein [Planctomycetota bacterium]